MPTPSQVLDISAADMNDSARETYTDVAMLPYLNMAAFELLQRMEESNIPITNKNSPATITVPAGDTRIAFQGTNALLPGDLVEITQIWESNDGGNSWSPMIKQDFIDPNIEDGLNLTSFRIYSWNMEEIIVPSASSDIILKFQYTRSIIPLPLTEAHLEINIPIKGCNLFLGHKTGALCALLITQDPERAESLNELAEEAIEREMNIPNKGRQAINTRRRPFRAGYKARNRAY